MATTLRVETTVLPGHRIESSVPEMPEGATVEVVVEVKPKRPRQSMLEFLRTLPPGPLAFGSAAEVNAYLQEERDSWGR